MKNIDSSKPTLVTNNVFDEALEQFKQDALFDRLQRKFTPRAYYLKFKNIRLFTLIASYLFNVFSALTASTLIYFFVLNLGTGTITATLCTFCFIVLLEIFKRKTSSLLFSSYLQYRKLSFLVVVVVAISSLSVAFSFYGSKKVVYEFSTAPTLFNSDTLTTDLTTELATINEQIKEANSTKWHGNTTRTAQKAIKELTKQKAIIQAEIIRVRERSDKSNDATIEDHTINTQINASSFAGFTLLLELLFLICAFYLEYYDFRSYAEFSTVAPVQQHTVQIPLIQSKQTALNGTTKQIPTTTDKAVKTKQIDVDTDSRMCLNCSVDISTKRKDAKYCSDECRRLKWTAKNGREPYLKSKG